MMEVIGCGPSKRVTQSCVGGLAVTLFKMMALGNAPMDFPGF